MHRSWNARAIVNADDGSLVLIARKGKKNSVRTRIPGVPQKLNNDVFCGTNVLSCLPSLSFSAAKTNEAASEVSFDSEAAIANRFLYECRQIFVSQREIAILFGIVHGATFANNHDFHLTGVLHLVFNLLGNVMREHN